MRILFLSPRYPYPPRRGDQVRAYHLASGLSRRADVTLLSFGDGPAPPESSLELRSIEPRIGGRIAGNLREPNPALPLQARLFAHSAMRKAVAEELAKGPDVVHVSLARMGTYLPPPSAGLHRHLDLVDSLSLNMRTRADASRGPSRAVFGAEARLMARYEARLAAEADSVSLVSAADRRAPGLAGAAVIPNGIDTDGVPYSEREADRAPVLAFFGNLGYFHNTEPARFVAEDVLPLVRASVSGASLRLAGARPLAGVRRLEGSPASSYTPTFPTWARNWARRRLPSSPCSPDPASRTRSLRRSRPACRSWRTGWGLMASRVPRRGLHYLAAETAEEFAASASALLEEPERRRLIAQAARELVLERYSWERQVESLLDLYGA